MSPEEALKRFGKYVQKRKEIINEHRNNPNFQKYPSFIDVLNKEEDMLDTIYTLAKERVDGSE